MANMWVASDHHFWHEAIIGYCQRPFSDVQEMNEALRANHNALVKPGDHVYFLGDVCMFRGNHMKHAFIPFIKTLNGHKRLLMGNHDHYPVQTYLEAGFEKVRGTGVWLDKLLLSHYPVHPGSLGKAKACVHGHIHANPSPPPSISDLTGKMIPYLNVCVEVRDYKPVSLDQLVAEAEGA